MFVARVFLEFQSTEPWTFHADFIARSDVVGGRAQKHLSPSVPHAKNLWNSSPIFFQKMV